LKSAVLDSYAVLAFLFKEAGHEKVLASFEKAIDADKRFLISASSWAEIRYMVDRQVGPARWKEVRAKLLGLPLEIIEADQELAELAGEIKASYKMSLANCFAAALAKQKKLEIYTGDPEFKEIEAALKIVWL